MSSLLRALRNHLHFVLISLVLTVVMTWPAIVHVFDRDVFWLPHHDGDVYVRFWEAWHVERVISGLNTLNFSDMLFYPVGMSLDLYPFNLFHSLLLAALKSVLPDSNAFSLAYLVIILVTMWAGYCFLNYFFRDKWLASFGAVVFGLSQHVVGHAHHPDLNLLATVPLALLALHRGVKQCSRGWMTIAGVVCGITVFASMYVFVCLLLTIGIFALYFALSRWRRAQFWIGLAVMLVTAALISAVRIAPMLLNQGELAAALNKNQGEETGNDLVASFVNYRHPVTTPFLLELLDIDTSTERLNGWRHTSYLGFLPLLLSLFALAKAHDRRKLLPWLLLFGLFFVLRLGSELRINDVIHSGVFLPKNYLNKLIPPVFASVHETDHFQIGILIPLAVLSCVGLRLALTNVSRAYRTPVVLAAISLVAFEYYYSPYSLTIAEQETAFINWLQSEPDQDQIRLINLPMGRGQSELYGFHQSFHGYPHVEGVAMRTPASSYEYIRSNNLLNTWFKDRVALKCSIDSFDSFLPAARQLVEDGFTHIVLHRQLSSARQLAQEFDSLDMAYQDRYTFIYRVPDLFDACARYRQSLEDESAHMTRFLQSTANRPQQKSTLLNFQPMDELSEDARSYFFRRLSDWGDLLHVFDDGLGNVTAQTSTRGQLDLEDVQTEGRIIWIVYNPQQYDLRASKPYAENLSPRLRSCQRLEEAEDLTIDIHLDRDYPCALITSAEPFAVRYDNGIRLQSISHELDGDRFKIYLWFSDEPVRGFGYSIQVYDDSNDKVLQLDDVIRNEPLSRHELDVSDLPPGEYRADLIVYHSESGKSELGWVLATGQSFQRALEIARYSVDH